MKGKKMMVRILTVIAVLSGMLATLFTVGCEMQFAPEAVVLSGFDAVKAEITVQNGELVEVDVPFVTDQNGNSLDVWFEVIDSNGGYVQVSENMFTATDPNGYVINYSIRTEDGLTHKKTTVVKVEGQIDATFNFSVGYSSIVEVGDEVALSPKANVAAEITYAVSYGEESVHVENDKFTADKVGKYSVKVTATYNEEVKTQSFDIFARSKSTAGEIEVFNQEWTDMAQVTGDSRLAKWSVVNANDEGITDRKGENGTILKTVSSDSYVYVGLSPRNSKAYYEQLAAEGYTKVSVWVYIAGDLTHTLAVRTDPNGGMYQIATNPVKPNQWNELTFNLADTVNDFNRSFISCYDYYLKNNMWFFHVDNSNEWNPEGHENDITVYVSDFYAVKDVNVGVSESAPATAEVGEAIDVSSLFTLPGDVEDGEFNYWVSFRGQRTPLTSTTLNVTANGEYLIEASLRNNNYAGSASLSFTASDDFALDVEHSIIARPDGAISLADDLGVAFVVPDGVSADISGYNVTYNGKAVEVVNGQFTAAELGVYNVEGIGSYNLNGIDCLTYHNVEIDICSSLEEIDSLFTNGQTNIVGSRKYGSWDGVAKTVLVSEYEGRNNLIKISKTAGEGITVLANPLHSTAYYEQMISQTEGFTYYVTFEYKAEMGPNNVVHIRYNGEEVRLDTNVWRREVIALDDLLPYVDLLRTNFNNANNFTSTVETGALLSILHSYNSANVFVTVPEIIAIPNVSLVDGGINLIDKTAQAPALNTFFDGSALEADFDLVWRLDGASIEALDLASIAEGSHKLELVAISKIGQIESIAYALELDVYDANAVNTSFVALEKGVVGSRAYGAWDQTAATEYLDNYDGRTNVTKISKTYGEGVSVLINPLHSVEYYEQLANNDQGIEYVIIYEYKYVSSSATRLFRNFDGTESQASTGEWHRVKINLKDLLKPASSASTDTYLDLFRAAYQLANKHDYNLFTAKSVLFGTTNSYSSLEVYVTTPQLVGSDSIEAVNGGIVLVDKAVGLDIETLFDKTDYLDKFDFEWFLDGEAIEALALEDLSNGFHTLDLIATNKTSEIEYVAYNANLDVYDGAIVELFANGINDVAGSKRYNWSGAKASTEYVAEYDGRANLAKITSASDGTSILINPLHSGAYYDALIKNNPDKAYYLTFEYNIVTTVTTMSFTNHKGTDLAKVNTNEWITYTVALSDFINYFDGMRDTFKAINAPAGNISVGSLFSMYNNCTKVEVYITLPTIITASSLETVNGGTQLVEASGSIDLNSLYDTSALVSEFEFTWKLDGVAIEEVDLSTLSFGAHTLTLGAINKISDVEYLAYTMLIDVYSADEAPAFVSSQQDVVGGRLYTGWDGTSSTTYLDSFDGRESVTKVTKTGGEGVTVLANPLHSAAYYQNLLANANGKEYYIVYEYYIESTRGTVNYYDYNLKLIDQSAPNVWKTVQIKLDDLIKVIDLMKKNYSEANANTANLTGGVLAASVNSYAAMSIYVTTPKLVVATPLETVNGGTKLAEKSSNLVLDSLFNTEDLIDQFDFTWTLNGEAIDTLDLTVANIGINALQLNAINKLSGIEYVAYTAELDVYDSAQAPAFVSGQQDVVGGRFYTGWDGTSSTTYLDSFDGRVSVTKVTKTGGEGMTVLANPLHSAAYYQSIIDNANGKEYYVVYEYYIESTKGTVNYYDYNFKLIDQSAPNVWKSVQIKLDDLVQVIDLMRKNYLEANKNTSNITGGILAGSVNSYAAMHIYITIPQLVAAGSVDTVDGGLKLVDKSAGEIAVTSFFSASHLESEYDLVWKLDSDAIEVIGADVIDGIHSLELVATNKLSGVEYVAYTAVLDVHSGINDTLFANGINDVAGSKRYNWSGAKASTEYVAEYDGRANLAKITSASDGTSILINPLHSGAYYDALIKNNPDKAYYLTFEYNIVTTVTTMSFTNHKGTNLANVNTNEWITYTVALSDFINYFDGMRDTFKAINTPSGNNTVGSLFAMYNNCTKVEVYITLPTIITASSLETVNGATQVVEKTAEIELNSLFNTDDLASQFDFAWTLNGEAIDTLDLTAANIGINALQLIATNKLSGIEYVAYQANIDVYDGAQDPAFVSGIDGVIGSRWYTAWDGNATNEYLDSYDGRNSVLHVTKSSSEGVVVLVNPLHSAEYYKLLVNNAEGAQYYVTFEYKYVSSAATKLYKDFKGVESQAATGEWHKVKINLADLVAAIDSTSSVSYIEQMFASFKQANSNTATFSKGYLFASTNSYSKLEIYVTMPQIVVPGTIPTVEGGIQLSDKANGGLDLNSLIDVSEYAEDFDFAWQLDGVIVESIADAAVGVHSLQLIATGKLDGAEYIAYNATLDVYEGSPVLLANGINDVAGSKRYSWSGAKASTEYGVEYDGRSNLAKITSSSDGTSVLINPLHTKAYYESLLGGENVYYVIFEYAFVTTNANISYADHTGTDKFKIVPGQWYSYKVELSVLIDYLEGMKNSFSLCNKPSSNFNVGALFGIYNNCVATEIYLTEPKLIAARALETASVTRLVTADDTLDLATAFDTAELEAEFDFVWKMGGETINSVDVSALPVGVTNVQLMATNKISGVEYLACDLIVDVYAEDETPAFVSGIDGVIGSRWYTAWEGNATNEYLDSYDGRNSVLHASKSSGEGVVVLVNPLHSAEYYRLLVNNAEGTQYYVTFEYKYVSSADTRLYRDFKGIDSQVTTGEWHKVKINLADLVAAIDSNSNVSYIEQMFASFKQANNNAATFNSGYLFASSNSYSKLEIYVTVPQIVAEAKA